MLCGIGFDDPGTSWFSKSKRRGLQSYVRISMINFFKAKPFPFMIESRRGRFNRCFLCERCHSNNLANNSPSRPVRAERWLAWYRDCKKDEQNHVAILLSLVRDGINALQKSRDHIDRRNIIYFQTRELVIHNEESAPCTLMGIETTEKIFRIVVKLRLSGYCSLLSGSIRG